MTFKKQQYGTYEVHEFSPWTHEGIAHGFIGTSGDFSTSQQGSRSLTLECKKFCAEFGVDSLVLLNQVHGKIVIDVTGGEQIDTRPFHVMGSGDAILCSLQRRSSAAKIAFGIRTADCLPVIMRRGDYAVVAHAGWRGLAAGILCEGLDRLSTVSDAPEVTVLIGPAAGETAYEVGPEVVAALSPFTAITRRGQEDKSFISLPKTAENQLLGAARDSSLKISIAAYPGCTISDHAFHSYRRSGPKRGSNLAFLITR